LRLDTLDRLVEDIKHSSASLVSANLCEAVSSMRNEKVDNSFDIGFDWSVLRRVASAVTSRPMRIQRDYFSRIEESRQELRAVENLP
jgi:hypothetical protein